VGLRRPTDRLAAAWRASPAARRWPIGLGLGRAQGAGTNQQRSSPPLELTMKPIKFVYLLTAAVTLLGIFGLAYLNLGEGVTLTLWEMRKLEVPHGYIILGALALPTLFGALALKNQRLPRWQSILSLVSYGIGLFIAMVVFTKTHTSFGAEGAIGAKLVVGALGLGAIAALAGTVKPETARA
jgi:hypothetical protein